jgi:hypothetical protein
MIYIILEEGRKVVISVLVVGAVYGTILLEGVVESLWNKNDARPEAEEEA